MTTSRDPDRLIRAFLDEGEERLNDQVYDAVRAVIDRRRQRGFLAPWRTPTMNRFAAFGLGTAAVVIAILVGVTVFGPRDEGIGTQPTPTAQVTASPEPTSSPTPNAGLPTGPHVFLENGTTINVTIPAAGWFGDATGGGILVKSENPDPPDGSGLIGYIEDDFYVYGDPCQWSTTRPDTPVTNAEELVAALADQASRDASEPVDITVGGYDGKAVTLHVPDDADFAACDDDQFASWGIGVEDLAPYRYAQGPGQIDEIWALDVGGQIVVLDWAHYAGTPPSDVEELRAIVESATFELP
jgi:hypothetical protein